jgi:RNA polymerase sigma factor (TIGR02999 family)
MPTGEISEITILLRRWRSGDAAAYDLIVERTHARLVAIASGVGSRERETTNTNPVGLVNEAYMRLRQLNRIEWQSREHFFSFAAAEIRRVLLARARRCQSTGRGGGGERTPLSDGMAWTSLPAEQILDLYRAMDELSVREPALVRMLELHYLLGYNTVEMSEMEEASESTIERNLRFARAWLNRRLQRERA